jgi:hypothetical protein
VASFEFGERLFLPVLMWREPAPPNWPTERPLWVYVLDPASVGLRNPTARVAVPYEPLEPGPTGALFAVDHRPLPQFLRDALDWPERLVQRFAAEPLDLDAPPRAISGGIVPSSGEPLFAGQMVYAVCQRVYDTFTKALGRYPVWGPWAAKRIREDKPPHLWLRPFACFEANAYFDDRDGALEFGVFPAAETKSEYVLPKGLVFLALSHDVIAHEVTHALLDGMRAHFIRDTNPDVPAFHEAFADLVALFHHFAFREVVEETIEQHGGLDSEVLLGLARQLGEAVHAEEGGALRHAVKSPGVVLRGDEPSEPHERGAVLVAAVLSAYIEVFQRRSQVFFRLAELTQGPANRMPHELVTLLADEACSIATEFLHVCIRAIDYCPPVDVRFGDYLRALITADRSLNPRDKHGIRDSLIKAFRRRNIDLRHVIDLSEYSLEWNGPAREDLALDSLAWSQLRLANDGVTAQNMAEVERQATELGHFALASDEVRHEFGLRIPGGEFGPVVIESIRAVERRSRDGRIAHGLVAELSQKRQRGNGVFVGGATVIFDQSGTVKFAIRKRVDDDVREDAQRLFRAMSGRPELSSARALHDWRKKRSP